MAEGYKAWAANDILNAADLNDYASTQSVMRFANAAGRDAALTTLVVKEGMVAYLKDSNILTVNTDGTTSGWREVSPAETSSIKDGAVTETKIANLAVTTGKIGDGAVTTGKIADGTIVNDDISASAAIAFTKLQSPAWTSHSFFVFQGIGGSFQTGAYQKIGRMVTARLYSGALGAGRSNNSVTIDLPIASACATGQVLGTGFFIASGVTVNPLLAVQLSSTSFGFYISSGTSFGQFTIAPNNNDIVSFMITYEATS
jgi:hypothetical protein